MSAQQKRAYRQRRKDPSCDACRERKVKCDATETSACSECSSRNVKCQFTKETNRRMSSMKQVQDLERQLQQVRKHNNDLAHQLQERTPIERQFTSPDRMPPLSLPDTNARDRRPPPPSLEGFDTVRSNIRNLSKGIFKPPTPYRVFGPEPTYPFKGQTLPPKIVVDRLMRNYHRSIHAVMPVLHWPTFHRQVEELYQSGTLESMRQTWVALFYAVLACGTLLEPEVRSSTNDTQGFQYLKKCTETQNTYSDELSMDHVQSALLTSVYFMEVNLRTPSWIWIGAAIRLAQDIGVNTGDTLFPPMEAEMRRRVWWSLYYWDRIVSLEVGRPLLINDDDCNVGEPTPVDDEYIKPHGIGQGQTTPNALLAVVPVVRTTAQLKKTFKSPTIARSTLETCDEHFRTIMETWPEPFRSSSQAPLEPHLMAAACSLCTQRFFLYRHNLSPVCRLAERQDALSRCVGAARDTARYVERGADPRAFSDDPRLPLLGRDPIWADKIRFMANAFFCSHLWRCELITALRGDLGTTWVLVQASSVVGSLRKNNIACGRFLAFFLDKLVEKLRAGATHHQLEFDEEILAYASGDMQGAVDNAWIWGGEQINTNMPHLQPPPQSTPSRTQRFADSPGLQAEELSTSTLTEQEMTDWGGWEAVQERLRHLIHMSQDIYSSGSSGPYATQYAQSHPQHAVPTDAAPPAHNFTPKGPSPYSPHAGSLPYSNVEQHHQHHQPLHHQPIQSMHSASAASRAPLAPPAYMTAQPSQQGHTPAPPHGNNGSNSRISIRDIM